MKRTLAPESAARVERLIAFCGALSLVIGSAARVRIYLASALPTTQPVRWFAAGTAQDVGITAILVLLFLLLARAAPRLAALAAAASFFVVAVLQFATAEAAIFFGHSVRPEDLQTGLHPRIFIGAAQGWLLASFVSLIVTYWFAVVAGVFVLRRFAFRVSIAVLSLSAFIAGVMAIALRLTHHFDTASHPITAAVHLARNNPLEQLAGNVVVPSPRLLTTEIRALMPRDGRTFTDVAYPLSYVAPPRAAQAPRIDEAVRPNIVFFLMEGIRAEDVGAYGGRAGVTPHFDRLAKESIFFEDAYSAGVFTPEGELGFWYGLLPNPYEIVIRTQPDVKLWGLPEALREKGWRDFLWIHPGDQSLYLSSRFYRLHGFKAVDGESFPEGEARTNWGYSDKALVRHAMRLMDRAAEPFASMVLTVSNHHPFQLPSDAGSRYEPPEAAGGGEGEGTIRLKGHRARSMLQTVHYTDEALGEFMALARQRPWFDRTIFVIASDHGNSVAPARAVRSEHDFFTLRHRVPMLIYSPLLPAAVIKEPASHVDVLPTLLGILGHTGARAGTGRDVFTAPAGPVVAWNSQAGRISVVSGHYAYHAAAASDGERLAILRDESLVDRRRDPHGAKNVLVEKREKAADLRKIALAYLDIYGWLIENGRSGLPSSRTRPR